MSTLSTAPIAPLLSRLFAAEQAASASVHDVFADVSKADFARMMHSKTEYLAFYARLKDAPLAVSRETGTLLYVLARSTRARTIVEFGTSFGISTLHLAAALRDNGGGVLITTEFEPSKAARARAHLEAGGVSDLVELREGDALETLSRGLPETIDMVLLDGAKALYPEVLARVEARLRPGALILADNADQSPEYMARVRAGDGRYMSLPFGPDVEVSMRVG